MKREALPVFPELSPTEQRIAMFLVDDARPGWIAEQLKCTAWTVSTSKTRLLAKLEVATVAGLTRLAIRRGYIQP